MIAFGNHRKFWLAGTVALAALVSLREARAQKQTSEPAKRKFTLEQAVDFALKNYPAVRASLERSRAAEAGVNPRIWAWTVAQSVRVTNRAKRLGVMGMSRDHAIRVSRNVILSVAEPARERASANGFEDMGGGRTWCIQLG